MYDISSSINRSSWIQSFVLQLKWLHKVNGKDLCLKFRRCTVPNSLIWHVRFLFLNLKEFEDLTFIRKQLLVTMLNNLRQWFMCTAFSVLFLDWYFKWNQGIATWSYQWRFFNYPDLSCCWSPEWFWASSRFPRSPDCTHFSP